jgi:hypothetical protein
MIVNQIHIYIFCPNFGKPRFCLAKILVGQNLIVNQSALSYRTCSRVTIRRVCRGWRLNLRTPHADSSPVLCRPTPGLAAAAPRPCVGARSSSSTSLPAPGSDTWPCHGLGEWGHLRGCRPISHRPSRHRWTLLALPSSHRPWLYPVSGRHTKWHRWADDDGEESDDDHPTTYLNAARRPTKAVTVPPRKRPDSSCCSVWAFG